MDRYEALGMALPDPETMCDGQCEGVGYYPENDPNEALWQEAEANEHAEDGWHFVVCPICRGSGKRK